MEVAYDKQVDGFNSNIRLVKSRKNWQNETRLFLRPPGRSRSQKSLKILLLRHPKVLNQNYNILRCIYQHDD